MTTQMEATEQYYVAVMLFVVLYKMVVTCESVDELTSSRWCYLLCKLPFGIFFQT